MDHKQRRTDNEEFDARMMEILGKGISRAGAIRFGSVFGFVNDALRINEDTVAIQGSIKGMMYFMIKDAVKGEVEMLTGTIHDDSDKDAIVKQISQDTDESSYDAVVTIAEVWSAPMTKETSDDFRPSESPERKEAVMTMIHINIDFQPCIITIIQDIMRNGNRAILDHPQYHLSTGDEIRGRFTGFEKQLCPIT